jgi:hypothetical protein
VRMRSTSGRPLPAEKWESRRRAAPAKALAGTVDRGEDETDFRGVRGPGAYADEIFLLGAVLIQTRQRVRRGLTAR